MGQSQAKQIKHPLDDEIVRVDITLIHTSTATIAHGTATSGGGVTLTEALNSAKQQVQDELLAQLEIIGG